MALKEQHFIVFFILGFLAIIFVATYSIWYDFAPNLSKNLDNCPIPHNPQSNQGIIDKIAGGYLRGDKKNKKGIDKKFPNCVVTGWNVSHTILYSVLGFLFPSHLITVMLFGITWETVESQIGNHDWMDLLYNFVGFNIGRFAAKKTNFKGYLN